TRKKNVRKNRKKSSRAADRYDTHRPPATPAKKADRAKANTLCLARLTPIASAAISSSRIACSARPKVLYLTLVITNNATASSPKVHHTLLPISLGTPE